MGVGYLLLYAAFAVVALWLVGELLLQYKAPLAWRAAALAGFLGVVGGMRMASVAVIGLGAAAFAVGQTFVTLSVKRGYEAGWSLHRPDGSLPGPLGRLPFLSAAPGPAGEPWEEPVGEVGPVEFGSAGFDHDGGDHDGGDHGGPQAPAGQQVYEMQPLHDDDSDGYGVYTGAGAGVGADPGAAAGADGQGWYDASYADHPQQDPYAAAAQGGYGQQTQYAQGYAQQGWYDASYAGHPQQDPYAAAAQGGYDQQAQYAQGYAQQGQYAQADWSQQAYAGYTVPQQGGDPQQHQQYHYEPQTGTWQPSA
ncbi:hypothetical protein [Streptomyces sp. NPDC001380]|uniref:hypothetical protein n=1 Tax=Streptomyces sp. NPDC001380 TaxID=3364566 RepID=UPI00368DA560